MSRWLYLAFFLTLFLAAVAAGHYYLWARFVRDPGWPQGWARVAGAVLVVLALSLPAALLASRLAPPAAARPLMWAAYSWMGLAFLLLVAAGLSDLFRLLIGSAARLLGGAADPLAQLGPSDPERRQLLARAVSVGAGAVSAGLAVHGLRGALGEIEVRQRPIALARLPRALDGLKVVQLSDVHVGPTLGRRFVEGIVEKTNACRPDLVVITGDLMDGPPEALLSALEPLSRLRARYGTFFVTGNHEYYSDWTVWRPHLESLGLRVLENERVSIGDASASFDLAGVPDPSAHRFPGSPPPSAAPIVRGRDPERELVLLAHQPRQIALAHEMGAGLMLAGHTHGGQVQPFGLLVALAQPYVAGHHREGPVQIYVSRGTGFWGPPMRIGAPAEITEIVLESTRGG
ncbi:MAG: metallophosphoesterase [Deltaproteobacteria bacterium]|nr:MAG: metallophosphoesterase [Deltaproteobacteria bacterium]